MTTKTDTTAPGYLAILPSLPFTDSDKAGEFGAFFLDYYYFVTMEA